MEAFGAIEADVLEPGALREATRRVPALRGALVERLCREMAPDGAPAEALGAAIGVALESTRAVQAARHASRLVGAGEARAMSRLDEAVCAGRPPPQTCLALLGALLALSDQRHPDVTDPTQAFPGGPQAQSSADAGADATSTNPDWDLMAASSVAEGRIELVSHLTSMIGQSLSATTAASDPISPRVIEQWKLVKASALPGWLTSGSPAAAAVRVRLASLLSSTGLSGAELARLWPPALAVAPQDTMSVPIAAAPDDAFGAAPDAATGCSPPVFLFGGSASADPCSVLPASLCHEVVARSRHAGTRHAVCREQLTKSARAAPRAAPSAPLFSSRATSLEGLTRRLASDPAVCLRCAAAALLDISSPHLLASAAGWAIRAARLPAPPPASFSPAAPLLHQATGRSAIWPPSLPLPTASRQPPPNETFDASHAPVSRQPPLPVPGWPAAAAAVAFYSAACDGARLELLLIQAALIHADSAAWQGDVAWTSAQGLVALLVAADGSDGAPHDGGRGLARGSGWVSLERAVGGAGDTLRVCGRAAAEDREAPEAWHIGAMAVRAAVRGARLASELAALLAVLRAESARGTEAVLCACEDLLIHSICADAREGCTRAAGAGPSPAQREPRDMQTVAVAEPLADEGGESPAEEDLYAEADARAMADVLPPLCLVRALAAPIAWLLSEPTGGAITSGGRGASTFVDSLPRRTSRLRLIGALLPAGSEAELLDAALMRAMSGAGARMPLTHAVHGAHDARSGALHFVLDTASWLATRLHTPFEYSQWLLRCLRTGQSLGASGRVAEDAGLCLLRAAADRARSGWEAPHVVLQQCAAAAAACSAGSSPASPALLAQGASLLAAALSCGVKPRRSVRSVLGGRGGASPPPSPSPPPPPLRVWLEGGCGCARLEWLLTLQAGGESVLKQRLQDLLSTGSGVQRWEHFASRGLSAEMHLLLSSAEGDVARCHVRRRLALLVGRLSRWRLPARDVLRALLAPPLPVNGDGDAVLSPLQLEAAVASYLEGDSRRIGGAADGTMPPAAGGPLILPNVAALAVSLVRMAALGSSSPERQAGADAILLFHAWLPTASMVQEARRILAQDRSGASGEGRRGRRSRGGESVRALQLLVRLPPRPADSSPVDWSSLFDEALVLRLQLPGEESAWPGLAPEPGTTSASERECDTIGEPPLPPAVLDWAAASLASLGPCPWLRWRLHWLMRRLITSNVALEAQRRWQQLWTSSGHTEAAADRPADSLTPLAIPGVNGAAIEGDAEEAFSNQRDTDTSSGVAAPRAAVLEAVDHDESSACPSLAAFVGWELCAGASGLDQHALGPATVCTLARDYLPSVPTASDRAMLAERVFCLTADRLFSDPVSCSQDAVARLMRACAELTSEGPIDAEGHVAAPPLQSSTAAEETGAPIPALSCWLLRALSSVSDALIGPRSPAAPEVEADGRDIDPRSGPMHDSADAGGGAPARFTDALVCCLQALPPHLLALTPQAPAPWSTIQAAHAVSEVLRRPALLAAPLLAELLLCSARHMRPAIMSVRCAAAGQTAMAVHVDDTASVEIGLHALAKSVKDTLDALQRAALLSALEKSEAQCVKPRLVATPWLAPQVDRLLSILRAACVAEPRASGLEANSWRGCAESPQLTPTTHASGTPAAGQTQGTLPSTWPKRKADHASATPEQQSKVRRAGNTASPLSQRL